MPSLTQNLSVWDETYDWARRGDEWSDAWGGVSHHWWTTLFPRLQGYVPAGRILEIAPGFGRWTHFLRDLCSELIIVDIAESAIAHCRERFAAYCYQDISGLLSPNQRSVNSFLKSGAPA